MKIVLYYGFAAATEWPMRTWEDLPPHFTVRVTYSAEGSLWTTVVCQCVETQVI